MTQTIPVQPPEVIRAKDSAQWLMDLTDYRPADGWSLIVDIANASNHYTKGSTDNGDGRHLISLATTDTDTWVSGDYTMAIAATDGTQRITIFTQPFTIKPSLQAIADDRSNVKKTLDAIESYMADSTNLTAASFTIGGRSLSRHSMTELLALLSRYRKLYQQEIDAARLNSGQKSRRRLLVRMQG